MLDYKSSENEESFENTFMSTFSVSYTDMYSCLQTIPLKENGQNIQVNEDNVQVDYILGTQVHSYLWDVVYYIRNSLIFIPIGYLTKASTNSSGSSRKGLIS